MAVSEGDGDSDQRAKGGGSLKDLLAMQIRARGGPELTAQPPAAQDVRADRDAAHPVPKPTVPSLIPKNLENEEEDEDEDMFATQDDPYSLFVSRSSRMSKHVSEKVTRDSLSDLFGSSKRSDSFSSTDSSLFGAPARASKAKRSSFSGLFGDANDDSLFDDVSAAAPIKESAKHAASDLFVSKEIAQSEKSAASITVAAAEVPGAAAPETKKDSKSLRKIGTPELFGSGGLFGDNDDDGVGGHLFAAPKTKTQPIAFAAPAITAQGRTTKVSLLFDEDEDEDDSASLFGGKSKPAIVPAKSSAASAVSSSNQPAREPDPVTKTAPITVAAKAAEVQAEKPKAKITASTKLTYFFDIEEADDGEDIFSTAKPATKPVPAATKAAVKSKSLFDDDDDDDGDLFGSKPAIVKPAAAMSKPKASSLFDEDNEDNVFGVPQPLTAAPIVQLPPATQPLSVIEPRLTSFKPASQQKYSVFDDASEKDMEDERLFDAKPPAAIATSSSSAEKNEVKESVCVEINIDNSSAGAKLSESSLAAPAEVTALTAAAKAEPSPSTIAVSSFSFPVPDKKISPLVPAAKEPVETAVSAVDESPLVTATPVPSPAPAVAPAVASVGKMSSGLASRLMKLDTSQLVFPGQAPPVRAAPKRIVADEESPEPAASAPIQSEVSNANLSRATVAGKTRRVPTKKAFSASKENSSLLSTPAPAPSSSQLFDLPAPRSAAEKSKAKPSLAPALFGDDDNTLFASKPTAAVAAAPTSAPPGAPKTSKGLFGDDSDQEALFTPTTAAMVSNRLSPAVPVPAIDVHPPVAVAAAAAPIQQAAAAAAAAAAAVIMPKKRTGGLFGDDDNDALPVRSAPAVNTSASTSKKSLSSLFGDDDDDSGGLFGPSKPAKSAALSVSTLRSKVAVKNTSDLFGDDDGDSLFVSPKAATAAAKPAAIKKSNLFGDDDEPLFGSSTNNATKKKGLFDD